MSAGLPDLINFSLLNSLQTSNIIVNVMIASLIPIIIAFARDKCTELSIMISAWFSDSITFERHYVRTIDYIAHVDAFGEHRYAKDNNTYLLYRAIDLYITKHCHVPGRYAQFYLNRKNRKCEIRLIFCKVL